MRYTGPYGKDWGNTYANICGTDEEGFSLPHGKRNGWNFSLHHWKKGKIDQLVPGGRLFGPAAAMRKELVVGEHLEYLATRIVGTGLKPDAPITLDAGHRLVFF